MYKTILFDLDGTILHTISDITIALNASLKACGYDFSYDDEGTKKLIGMGARNIIARAFKNRNHTTQEFDRLLEVFTTNYKIYQGQTARPYEGIIELLNDLKGRGIKLLVASNKPDHLAKEIVKRIFGLDLFDDIYGHQVGKPEKPDPYLVDYLLDKHQINHEETLFVGDSDVDVATGINSSLKVALVTWGYGDYNEELLKKATYVVNSVSELKSIVFA
ncbi:MAG: HAD family hydrolase [Bacilli bacterium]|nr:HAD family hydrolase [Bacilli bacterium]